MSRARFVEVNERIASLELQVRALRRVTPCHCGHLAIHHLDLLNTEDSYCTPCYPRCRAYSPAVSEADE